MAESTPNTTANTPRQQQLAGGFLPPQSQTLPSPAPSTASSRAAARLPAPRSKPLAPGSRKEDYARDYVSQRLLHVSRRFVKKHGGASEDVEDDDDDETVGKWEREGRKEKHKEVPGYESADQMCADLEEVVDVLWFSGTPSLQIPYLINVASALTTYLPSFPPSPRPTFALLQKLDHCFASLLVGRDVKTRDPLPGFRSASDGGLLPRAGLSRTDMVRVKSIADETRMLVAVVMSGEIGVENNDDDGGDADGGGGDGNNRGGGNKDNEDRILDPFVAQIDPGEGVVYRLKPEGDYGGFVAEEDTDDEDDEGFNNDYSGSAVRIKQEDTAMKEGDADTDDDDDGDGFVDVAQPKMIPKRKVDDDVDLLPDPGEEVDEGDLKKRIKTEGEELETPTDPPKVGGDSNYDINRPGARIQMEEEEEGEEGEEDEDTPIPDRKLPSNRHISGSPPRRPNTVADDNDGSGINSNNTTDTNTETATQQFHFALDEDEDEDDDDSGGETLPNTSTGASRSQPSRQQQQQRRRDEGDENNIDDQDVDEEEEELHMNVAKVYEKTLVQLGKSLGESILDT